MKNGTSFRNDAAAAEKCFLLLAGTARFAIVWCPDASASFDFDLSFTPPLLGRSLREEIARRKGVRAAEVKLQQIRKRREDGALLVESPGSSGYWCDEKGEREELGASDLKVDLSHIIQDDQEVPVAGNNELTWIHAYKA